MQRFHVIERESWNKTLSNQVSSAATPISLVSVATEKMSQNRTTYDVSKPSWLTVKKVQTIRLSLLAAVASGIAIIAVSPRKDRSGARVCMVLIRGRRPRFHALIYRAAPTRRLNTNSMSRFNWHQPSPAEVFSVSVILAVVIPHDRGRPQQF